MQLEKYIGLKYVDKGRDYSGVDCWGLVRLIYKNELHIDLPSFSADYDHNSREQIAELIAQYKEGWEQVNTYEPGDIVLFRILGSESHVGVVVDSQRFIHVRENSDSVIETFDSPYWKKRVIGVFRYNTEKSVVLNAVPHPLKTQRYTIPVLPGTTVQTLVSALAKEYNVSPELEPKITILVNTRVVPQDQWNNVVLNEGDVVEYRALPGRDVGRMFLMLAVVLYAPQLAGALETGFAAATAGANIGASMAASWAAGTVGHFATTALVTIAGMGLVNAIAPIRPPAEPRDPGSSERQLMVDGGNNQINPYGSIPVVLGRVRTTPPLGSVNYLTYENDRDSFVSMLLVWGYGPLYIDQSTFRLGDIPLAEYPKRTGPVVLDRITEPSVELRNSFDAIYGKDYDSVQIGTELTCDGDPNNSTRTYSGTNIVESFGESTTNRIIIAFTSTRTGQNIEAFINGNISALPGALYPGLTNVVVTDINSSTRKITATTTFDATVFNYPQILYTDLPLDYTATWTATAFTGLAAGPWLQAATDPQYNADGEVVGVDSYTLALHFPQGQRRIKTKGSGAGDSTEAPVAFKLEYSTDGATTWNLQETFVIGNDAPKKDGFTTTRTYSFTSKPEQLAVRVRRETGDDPEPNDSERFYFVSVLQGVTFTRNISPVTDPLPAKLAMTALKLQATDQLNGRVDGFNGIVQTWCKKWNGTAWVDGASNNPAALMRYVLQHPANPRRVEDTQLNLTQLQYFYNYCESKGFTYNSVIASPRSVLETLRDICAAGRASPALVDGKWTVVIDEPRTIVVQHFSPHNSWGFESSKPLPKRPDGLRVTFYDEDRDFQENEIIVYDIGKTSGNATLFESISLPGVTKKSLVIDHAKWHMAQLKLRPEFYSLNVDIEYLVCNRGDRVRVAHDVPQWGLGSGRIKNVVNSTTLELDEELLLVSSTNYVLRIRNSTGSANTYSLVPVTVDGYYSTVTLTTAIVGNDVEAGDLFLFGENGSESQDLIVLAIEPTNAKSAKLTLVDYGVTDTYNIYTDYQSLSSSTVFESQISNTPRLLQDTFGDKRPTLTGFVSDESVMERVAKGIFKYNISVAYTNAAQLPTTTDVVEAEYSLVSSTDNLATQIVRSPYQTGHFRLPDVAENETYKIRARYISRDGRIGLWSDYTNHTVVGKRNPPAAVANFVVAADKSSGQLKLSWNENLEPDTSTYEIRTVDTGWGTDSVQRVFLGDATRVFLPYTANGAVTYYIRAVDSSGNYSLASTSATFTPSALPNPTGFAHSFADTALTSATVEVSWSDVTTSEFLVAYYEVSYDSVVKTVKGNTIILPADWLGTRNFTIKTVDINNKISSGAVYPVDKFAPNPPQNITGQVVDNTVMLFWNLPARTSLPIDHVLIKRGPSWTSPDKVFGDKKGEFTTISENVGGTYKYWLACVDTEGVESSPVEIIKVVAEPPDFVFNASFNSDFSGTKVNAIFDGTVLTMPVNTTETFAQHFDSRSWTNPADQIAAGYPYYIQPTTTSGYYEEVFELAAPLASSRVLVTVDDTVIAGNPVVTTSISLSADGVVYELYAGQTEVFGLNFKYIKVRVEVSASAGGLGVDLLQLSAINVTVDAKLKNEAGNVYAAYGVGTYTQTGNTLVVTLNNHGVTTGTSQYLTFSSGTAVAGYYNVTSTTTNTFTVFNPTTLSTSGGVTVSEFGTIVNFPREFIDVQSVVLSPNATTPIISSYDFQDYYQTGTYSVVSQVCTVTATAHGLIAGQDVKLVLTSGSGASGVYRIVSATANTFVVSMSVANTSGNCSLYPQSFRVYLYTTGGTRTKSTASWAIKGY